MTANSLVFKKKLGGTPGPLTPSNSPTLKPSTRSPIKSSSYPSYLSLQTVIGSTTHSSNGFDCLPSARLFAHCAASSVVVGRVDEDFNISQRYFRASPNATSLNPSVSYYQPSPIGGTPEVRNRFAATKNVNGGISSPTQASGERNEVLNSRTWTSRDRIKACTSVSLSPDGRHLAVGETGYCPRIIIFSTELSNDIPLSILTEHSFGVRSLAFSPNSQYLASLGEANDGFLFVWQINSKTGSARLQYTNKCTSTIHAMTWVGNNLITVGTRHIKVWRIPDGSNSPSKTLRLAEGLASLSNPAPKALIGRNCLLGPLVDSIFTCVCRISDQEAVVATDKGAVCFLDDTNGTQKFQHVANVGFHITSIICDVQARQCWLGGVDGRIYRLELTALSTSTPSAQQTVAEPATASSSRQTARVGIIGLGMVEDRLITLDSSHSVRIRETSNLESFDTKMSEDRSTAAHSDAVLGIGYFQDQTRSPFLADFFTWSSAGQVKFWDLLGHCLGSANIPLEQIASNPEETFNELKVLRASEDMNFFVSGDKLGIVKLMIGSPGSVFEEVRAHGGEVTDIALYGRSDPDVLIATCSRDRIVQVFGKKDSKIDLIQTLEDHVGAVSHVLFANEGERLLSCSSDRTVVVREKVTREVEGNVSVAFFPLQVITLKSSPVSMSLLPDDPELLVVSTLDRQIQRHNLLDGRLLHSWKPSDFENNAVVMGSMNISTDSSDAYPRVLVGVSTTDKSIRIYDYERETLLTGEFGHTEGVSDVFLIEPKSSQARETQKKILVSTGLDGIIIIWNLTVQRSQDAFPSQITSEDTPSKELTSAKTPLRRILSMSKLAEFQKLDGTPVPITPTRDQSPPRLRRKTSRFALGPQLPKITPASTPAFAPLKQSPTTNLAEGFVRTRLDRSPSPPSPRNTKSGRVPRPSLDSRARTKSYGSVNEYGTLSSSSIQLCKSLRTYRKRLNTSSVDQFQSRAELCRELELTLKALGRKTEKVRANSDSEMEPRNVNQEKDRRRSENALMDRDEAIRPIEEPLIGSHAQEESSQTETTENTGSATTQSETETRGREPQRPENKSSVAVLRARLEQTGNSNAGGLKEWKLDPDGEG